MATVLYRVLTVSSWRSKASKNLLQRSLPPILMNFSCVWVQLSILMLRTFEMWLPRPLCTLEQLVQMKVPMEVLAYGSLSCRMGMLVFGLKPTTLSADTVVCSTNRLCAPGAPAPTVTAQNAEMAGNNEKAQSVSNTKMNEYLNCYGLVRPWSFPLITTN